MVSMIGDQFTSMALPWLVLKMTGSALTMGLVIAIMATPRAVFILIGGAVVDRYAPKRVLMATKYINAMLLGVLAALVASGLITMPLVYAATLAIGLASAFSIPAGSSILPYAIAPDQLPAANGMLMGQRQLSMLAGPIGAGLLIGLSGHDTAAGANADMRGLGMAFAVDCLSFISRHGR